MTIRTRILALVAALFAVYTVGWAIWKSTIDAELRRLFDDAHTTAETSLRSTAEMRAQSLRAFTNDYTVWDEMVRFVATPDCDWAKANIEAPMASCGVTGVYILDSAGTPRHVHSTAMDTEVDSPTSGATTTPATEGRRALPPSLRDVDPDFLRARGPIFHFFADEAGTMVEYHGAAITATADTERAKPAAGWLFVARHCTPEALADLGRAAAMEIGVRRGPTATAIAQSADSATFTVEMPLVDIRGSVIGALVATSARPAFALVSGATRQALTGVLMLAALLAVVLAWCLCAWVANPLSRMGNALRDNTAAGIAPLLENRTELGAMARLLTEFLARRRELIREVVQRRTAEHDLSKSRDTAIEGTHRKSAFLASMSHEIRTPMNGVIGMADILLGSSLDARQRDCAATIRDSAHALVTLISDILDFSKIEAGRMELCERPTDVGGVVDDVLRLLGPRAEKNRVRLTRTVRFSGAVAFVADGVRLRQVLVNLVGNAIKFTHSGRVDVKITAGPVEKARRRLSISIRDTGLGIPRNRRAAIFDSYTQADGATAQMFGGTGLGLTISRQLVELMGGTLMVRSRVGTGSVFRIDVRLLPAAAPPAVVAPLAIEPGALSGMRVLLAEDDSVNQKVACAILSRFGASVVVTSDGAAAVAAAKAASDPFDVILMDCQMPVLNGLDATAAIRVLEGDARHTPIIAMTADAMTGDRERCLAAGMDDYVTKPVDQMALYTALCAVTGIATPVADA